MGGEGCVKRRKGHAREGLHAWEEGGRLLKAGRRGEPALGEGM